jgi:glycosyltransferase involved in cell wall biosynthesis
VTFHLAAAVAITFDRLVRRRRYDLVQTLETASFGADVVGVQFCHGAYLRTRWRDGLPRGLRGALRWTYEWCAARLEPFVFRRARVLVVPSQGLADELAGEFAFLRGKIEVVRNAVEADRAIRPEDFDRAAFRRRHGLRLDSLVLVFVALGHFERKGLDLVLDALTAIEDLEVQVLVVGGTRDLVALWQQRVRKEGREGKFSFVGPHDDIRPFLWASDAFVFPSAYETFSYASFEAAAAGLPVIVSKLHGVDEFLVDGETGLLVERTPASVAAAIRRVAEMDPDERKVMGERAHRAVTSFNTSSYVAGWAAVYERLGRRDQDGSTRVDVEG